MADKDAAGLSRLDANQVIRKSTTTLADGSFATQVLAAGGNLVPEQYDEIDLTYVAAGNGAGEIGTVTYSLSGQVIATLTLTYNAQNKVSNVTRS